MLMVRSDSEWARKLSNYCYREQLDARLQICICPSAREGMVNANTRSKTGELILSYCGRETGSLMLESRKCAESRCTIAEVDNVSTWVTSNSSGCLESNVTHDTFHSTPKTLRQWDLNLAPRPSLCLHRLIVDSAVCHLRIRQTPSATADLLGYVGRRGMASCQETPDVDDYEAKGSRCPRFTLERRCVLIEKRRDVAILGVGWREKVDERKEVGRRGSRR